MARQPNYDFEKRRKEQERKRKQDEKAQRKRDNAARRTEEGGAPDGAEGADGALDAPTDVEAPRGSDGT